MIYPTFSQKKQEFSNKRYIGFHFFKNFDSQIYKNTIFRKCVHLFLHFVNYFGICKSMNKGPPGLKNQEIVKMLGFDPSHNNAEILLDQNWSE